MKNILVTNDDGIDAKGIRTLVKALSEIANVYVVAPDTQRSACGHGITMHVPMVVREAEFPGAVKAWATSGTPADCIKLGVKEFVDKVDLVVSGTNMGANVGNDCFYSGTVSGAAEGIFCDCPAVAMSICSHHPKNYEPSMKMAQKVVQTVFEKGLEPGVMLNVNLPDIPAEEIQGVRVTKIGRVSYKEGFKHGISNSGNKFYWYNGEPIKLEQDEDSDIQAIRDKYISISPLRFDITDYASIDDVKKLNIEFEM